MPGVSPSTPPHPFERAKVESILDREMDLLEDVKSRLMNLQVRLKSLEDTMTSVRSEMGALRKVVNDKIPDKLLSEEKFLSELQSSDEAFGGFLNDVKGMVGTKSAREIIAERVGENDRNGKPTVVESKRMERITLMLNQHGNRYFRCIRRCVCVYHLCGRG